MDLTTAIKAKIAAGVLPHANGIAVDHVVGCDTPFASDGVGGVQFDAGSEKRLLHVECYVVWTEACAD
jgi:hypothetical protein